MKSTYQIVFISLFFITVSGIAPINAHVQNETILTFDFEGNLKSTHHEFEGQGYTFTKGIDGQAIIIQPNEDFNHLSLDKLSLDGTTDFSIQCWVKTTSKKPTVLLSQKGFMSKGITAQKNAGWVLYSSGGTFAWSVGSGTRRVNYERDNGEILPINDDEWHQITITYNKVESEFRLYYDGHNKAIYKVSFDFSNIESLTIGTAKNGFDFDNEYLPEIVSGAKQLQAFVDTFNEIGLEPLKNDEFIDFISDTQKIFEEKLARASAPKEKYSKEDFTKALAIKEKLFPNPYTVYQIRELTVLLPISKIYALKEGKVVINDHAAKFFTEKEKLYPSDFAMDKLSIWNKVISSEEVMSSFAEYRKIEPFKLTKNINNLTVAVWNIWNGGIHWSLKEDGWDSRLRIAEIIKEKNADVILMQETYSAGDFIAAELGYYFATTSDYDPVLQGSNISVLSRYPIKEIEVPQEAESNNVGVKLTLSETQEIYAVSNWFGMNSFSAVYDFYEEKFNQADAIPVLFGGDFNAVPHTDGGKSPASVKMLENGFTDSYRSLHPNVDEHPGLTHRSGRRIDQLYFKGKGLKNKSIEVFSTWTGGFPSDHFLIVSEFELD